MKIKRSWLLAVISAFGVSLVAYTLLRQFAGISLGAQIEKFFFDTLVIAALAIFMLNRKLAADEKKEAEAAKEAKPPEQEKN